MALDPLKTLDIDALEAALDELLEHYRQALRAVELLPKWGHVPHSGYLSTGPIRSRFACRWLARMFLRSHIWSKLRTIAGHLEVERFASGHMDANTSKRLGNIIKKLRVYDKSFADRRTFWSRVPGWIWTVAASVLLTYFTTRGIPGLTTVIIAQGLVYVATGLLYVAILAWLPLSIFVASGGFDWKRLILLGQTGDMNIGIASNAVLHWVSMPRANTYEAENRLFGTLGLPKPSEFPWDLVLMPPPLLSTVLILALFMFVLAITIPAKEVGWPLLTAIMLFLALIIYYLRFTVRPIFRAMRERREHSAC